MLDTWMTRKVEEIQGYAGRNEWKNFLAAVEAVCEPTAKRTTPLFSADGTTVLTEKAQILKRWAEYFRSILNRPSAISDPSLNRLPQVETTADLDLPPSLHDTIRVAHQPSSWKAPKSDAIPAEINKHGDSKLLKRTGPSGFQGRHSRPSLQAERGLPSLRQPPRHFPAEHCRKNLRSSFYQSPQQLYGAGTSTGNSVRFSPSSWDQRHDFC
nr:unnamed protein product [Spirometra erinaceieuropaei]